MSPAFQNESRSKGVGELGPGGNPWREALPPSKAERPYEYLVDPARIICLSQSLSHACVRYLWLSKNLRIAPYICYKPFRLRPGPLSGAFGKAVSGVEEGGSTFGAFRCCFIWPKRPALRDANGAARRPCVLIWRAWPMGGDKKTRGNDR